MDFKVGDKVYLLKNLDGHPEILLRDKLIGTIVLVRSKEEVRIYKYGVDFKDSLGIKDEHQAGFYSLGGVLKSYTGRYFIKGELALAKMPEIKVFKNPRYKELFI